MDFTLEEKGKKEKRQHLFLQVWPKHLLKLLVVSSFDF